MKKFLLITFLFFIGMNGFSYDKGLFDVYEFSGDLKAEYQIREIPSDGKPGLSSFEEIVKQSKVGSYFKIPNLPQKGINAVFKVIKDEGYKTNNYNTFVVVFSTYSFSSNAVLIFVKFDKDGSAWIEAFEIFK
jgi:hypothetical protein